MLFPPPAVGSQQKPENDLSGFENRGWQNDRENFTNPILDKPMTDFEKVLDKHCGIVTFRVEL